MASSTEAYNPAAVAANMAAPAAQVEEEEEREYDRQEEDLGEEPDDASGEGQALAWVM